MAARFKLVKASNWSGPADVKVAFGTTVDFLADNRIIFDIGSNKYRIVVHVAYRFGKVLVKSVGTHKDYDAIKAETIS